MGDEIQRSQREMEEELRLLQAENEALAEQAEQVELLGTLAEAVLRSRDATGLITQLLESLSILKDIRYCALWQPGGEGSGIVDEYAAFAEDQPSGALFNVPDGSPDAFAQACAACATATALSPAALQFPGAAFKPSAAAVLPFDTAGRPSALLLFADDRRSPAALLDAMEEIDAVVTLARTRLDIIAANEQLSVMNADLEEKVLARTRELANAKAALRSEAAERRRFEVALHHADVAFDSSQEGVIITDASQQILSVNRAFCRITGYLPEEVIGKTPRLLRSERHDAKFYRSMWDSIHGHGRWEGEIWNRRKDGNVYGEHLTITAVRDEQGAISHYVGVFSDITVLKASQAKVETLTHYDPLTELPNRLLFQARLDYAAERARRDDTPLAVAILGIDQFKTINATLGTELGNAVLRETGRRLAGAFSQRYTVARLSGDEYALLLENLPDADHIAAEVQMALEVAAAPVVVDGNEIFVTCSAGVARRPASGDDGTSLLGNAYAACIRAKQSGRGSMRFAPDERGQKAKGFLVESELRRALRRNEFVVHYQPTFMLATGQFAGVEALVRWQHPERGLLLPDSFIPAAEESGLIEPLGAWVLGEACRQASSWMREGLPPFQLAVNVSTRQLKPALVNTVDAVLAAHDMSPALLELEITERSLLPQAADGIRALGLLKDRGVRVAIDDFGTGYSSMAYLKTLQVDKLKIDRMFVKDLPNSRNDDAIARTIITLAHGLGLTVTAEGVETQAQADYLRRHGCDQVQGYLYGRPVPASAVHRGS